MPGKANPKEIKYFPLQQFAPGQTGTSESTTGSFPATRTRSRTFSRRGMETK